MTKYVKCVWDLLLVVRDHPVNFSLPECEYIYDLCICFSNAFINEIEGGVSKPEWPFFYCFMLRKCNSKEKGPSICEITGLLLGLSGR